MSRFIGMARVTPAVLAISAMAGSAQAAQVGSAQQGLRLARSVCSECHLVVKEAGRSNEPAPYFEAMPTHQGSRSSRSFCNADVSQGHAERCAQG